MSKNTVGRHRAPGRINPVTQLSSALAQGARPAIAATATLAAAGGMVAGLAGPAVAAPAPAAPNAPAAEAVVLSGGPSAQVAYGLPVVKPAATATSKTNTFATVALSARPKAVAAAPVATTMTQATGSPARAPRTTAYSAPAPVAARAVNPAPTGGVLGIAAGLSGIPYSWGGTTPAGFDCSGYVQYVFRQAGISLPRTAGAQRAVASYVSNPQPGDLVFFGTWHVGIYAGNGMMYDSPTSGQTTGLHRIWSSSVTYGRVG